VWIQGNLHAATRNNPSCFVNWGWHVAPWLCVRGPSFPQTVATVIDPSLFTTPVSKAAWKGVQGDVNASLTDSDGSIFYLWGNVTEPSYVQSNQVLRRYRAALQADSLQVGAPRYALCPRKEKNRRKKRARDRLELLERLAAALAPANERHGVANEDVPRVPVEPQYGQRNASFDRAAPRVAGAVRRRAGGAQLSRPPAYGLSPRIVADHPRPPAHHRPAFTFSPSPAS
jgi:hypothetical protein